MQPNSKIRFLSITFGAIVLCLTVFAHVASSQGRFTATAPKAVAENQNFNLTYTLDNASGSSLRLPSLNDFTLLSGPSTSTSMQIMNGSVSQSSSYTYVLRPKQQGTFKIGKATIEVSGNSIESNELTIQVTAASSQSQPQQGKQQQNQESTDADLVKQLKDDVFMKVILSRNSVYKGEMLSATYKLYFRQNLDGFNLTKSPAMEGFWSKEVELDPKRRPTIETVNGKQYNTLDVLKYNLYPQRSGVLQISPAEISTTARVTVRGRSRDPFSDPFGDPFSDFFGQTKNVPLTLTTGVVSVSVRELPDSDKPKDFAGAVGKFNLETSLSAKEAKTDDPVTYTIKISGNGNLSLIDAPKALLPDGFEVYDPKVKENISNGALGISGSKQYDYLIVPRMPGDYKIGGQTFSYFDPSAGKYVTISTPEFPLKITGEPSKNANTNSSSYITQQDVSLLGQDIRYIKTSGPSFDKSNKPFFGSAGFIALYSFPFLAFIGLIVARRRNEELAADITGTRRRRALKVAKKRLRLAEKNLLQKDKKNFYDEVSRAIWGYLGDKLNIEMSELSKETVAEKLFARNVKPETITKLRNLINSCELSLYAPASDSEMKNDYTSALNLIADLEDEIKVKAGDRSLVRPVALFLALTFCTSFAVFSQSPIEIYNQANQSYKEKLYRQAAEDFEKLISQGYKNAEVYYDLGNCYYKMDSIGKCILNYERALKLAPKDEDLTYNLKLAKLRAVDNIQPVPQLGIITWWNNFVSFTSTSGWSIFALIAIWLSIFVFAISFLFRRRRIFNVLAFILLFVSFSSLALAIHQHQEEGRSDAAVVMVSSSYVKSAPDAGASDLFMIHEGARLQLLDRVGEWNKIRLEDGKVGWIGEENFEKI